jgi:hypothetical protein
MSTLEYLDGRGGVSFTLVPWTHLNQWLSLLNGDPCVHESLPDGVKLSSVIEELEARRKRKIDFTDRALKLLSVDRGLGLDWRDYENEQGYNHFEELLIYQPKAWRVQAREYLYLYGWDITQERQNRKRVTHVDIEEKSGTTSLLLRLTSPVHVVLFHPDLKRTSRYEPLNFLLAYGARDPRPAIFNDMALKSMGMTTEQQEHFRKLMSPLDWFLEFQKSVQVDRLDVLRVIGKGSSFDRVCLMKEFDFGDIIGQRMAKEMIRDEVVDFIKERGQEHAICSNRQPLSMIFAGPSGVGKTELAGWLAELLNKPGQKDEKFLKVDCGKLTAANEVFGMSGAYQGSQEGSALKNFVLLMSGQDDAIGIVLLDEIEKAGQCVIHGLYQVIDKGEWTNKKLVEGKGTQTEMIPCHNLIFVMTTNAADKDIHDFVKRSGDSIYTTVDDDEWDDIQNDLESRIRKVLQNRHPFTAEFMGRVGRVIPFLPLANGNSDRQPLLGETDTVAKFLIERELERRTLDGQLGVSQRLRDDVKERIAKMVSRDAIPEAGVRSIQQLVKNHMVKRIDKALRRERGGIREGSDILYWVNDDKNKVGFRVTDVNDVEKKKDSEDGTVAEGFSFE